MPHTLCGALVLLQYLWRGVLLSGAHLWLAFLEAHILEGCVCSASVLVFFLIV